MKENLNMGGKYSIGVFGKNLIGVDIGISHAINNRICELDDEEEDACKGKKETISEEEDRRDTEDQHAQPQAVQLPEAYVPGDDQGLQGTVPEIILSQSLHDHVVWT